MKKNQSGLSLIEILISISVAGILIIGAASLIASTLRISAQNNFFQGASFLSQEIIEKVAIFAEIKWYCPDTPMNCGIYNLNKGSSNFYHLSASVPFTAFTGKEIINLNGVDFLRHFYVEDVSRDEDGDIETIFNSENEDISTQRITAITSWPNGGEVKIIRYVVRSNNKILTQSDWQGGSGHGFPEIFQADSEINVFDTKTNIDISKSGSIELKED